MLMRILSGYGRGWERQTGRTGCRSAEVRSQGRQLWPPVIKRTCRLVGAWQLFCAVFRTGFRKPGQTTAQGLNDKAQYLGPPNALFLVALSSASQCLWPSSYSILPQKGNSPEEEANYPASLGKFIPPPSKSWSAVGRSWCHPTSGRSQACLGPPLTLCGELWLLLFPCNCVAELG